MGAASRLANSAAAVGSGMEAMTRAMPSMTADLSSSSSFLPSEDSAVFGGAAGRVFCTESSSDATVFASLSLLAHLAHTLLNA